MPESNEKQGASSVPVDKIVGQEFASLFVGEDGKLDSLYKTTDGHIFATDGHMAVKIAGDCTGFDILPNELDIIDFNHHQYDNLSTIPNFNLPTVNPVKCAPCKGTGKIRKCEECEGVGGITFESEYNSYEVECLSCWGEGFVHGGDTECHCCMGKGETAELIPYPVVINDYHVNGHLLDKILKLRPTAKISLNVENGMHFLKFKDGYAVIMGMLK